MPMFYTPKPHRFNYQPRFYDPEKEKWEAMKQKYADQQTRAQQEAQAASDAQRAAERLSADTSASVSASAEGSRPAAGEEGIGDLAYFEHRVRQIDSQERKEKAKMKVSDLFKKRAMPTFHYQPRFEGKEGKEGEAVDAEGQAIMQRMRKHKISRRFDIEDEEYMKPVSAGKIMMYALISTLLLLWIFL